MNIKGNSVGYPFPDPRNGLEMRGSITGLNDPDADDQAANKSYVDAAVKNVDVSGKVDKANVVNNFTTTEEGFVADARALKTLNDNKLSMELLWENASPTSVFAEQTVSIDYTNFDFLMLSATVSNTSQEYYPPLIIKAKKGIVGLLTCVFNNDGANTNVRLRKVTLVESGVQFGNGQLNGSAGANYCVPQYVYGIKGVS